MKRLIASLIIAVLIASVIETALAFYETASVLILLCDYLKGDHANYQTRNRNQEHI